VVAIAADSLLLFATIVAKEAKPIAATAAVGIATAITTTAKGKAFVAAESCFKEESAIATKEGKPHYLSLKTVAAIKVTTATTVTVKESS